MTTFTLIFFSISEDLNFFVFGFFFFLFFILHLIAHFTFEFSILV